MLQLSGNDQAVMKHLIPPQDIKLACIAMIILISNKWLVRYIQPNFNKIRQIP